MTSVLRQLQAEWNSLVPAAQARRIPRVRLLNLPLETIAYRRTKLEWLKAQLGVTTTLSAAASIFDPLTFGVEIEFLTTYGNGAGELARRLTAAGVETASEVYNHRTGSTWKIVTDGSVHSTVRGWTGLELVSPPLRGEAGLDALRRACEVLTAAGCKINRTCGLHVHVGVMTQQVGFFKNLVKLYATAQGTIDTFLSPSRRGSSNSYCREIWMDERTEARVDAATTVSEVAVAIGQTGTSTATARGPGRYRKLNLQSFWQHGTVEFRHHQGTVDAAKAGNWVRLVLRMCLLAQRTEKKVAGFDDLMTALEVPGAEQSYFRGRIEYFNRPARRRAA